QEGKLRLSALCVFAGCALCRRSDDDPAMFGEKLKLEEENFSVHYFCLLTSSGVYQRGEESEGVFGFLVDDIKQEIRRASRLTCFGCKKKGACVGCNVRSCRRVVHFPCGRNQMFITQFTEMFPSYCQDHSPTQTLSVDSDFSLPQSCSICLDSIHPILSYSVLKCPSCHTSWFHRDCVFYILMFFFFFDPLTFTNMFLNSRIYSFTGVMNTFDTSACKCFLLTCEISPGGFRWFEVIRCCLCGSRGTHRKCSGLQVDTRDWACSDCINATDGKGLTWQVSGLFETLLSPPGGSSVHAFILPFVRPCTPVRPESAEELLQSLLPHQYPVSTQVEVHGDQALSAGLELVRRADFDPMHSLSPDRPCSSLCSPALREDLYFDIGSLLALCLVHGGPPIGFFSHALYQCLFNYPANRPLTLNHMTPNTHFTQQVHQIAAAQTLDELKEATRRSWEYLELAGCNRLVTSLEDREALVEDLVNFTMITRMQLPLQRLREGLHTLGVFDQVQLIPSVFFGVFCEAAEPLTAETLSQLFTVSFSEQEDKLNLETPVVTFWRHLLLECEVGRSSVSLEDVLRFATGANKLPAAGLFPPPSISFLHRPWLDEGLFPQSKPTSNKLLLPVTSTYKAFKCSMEHLQDIPVQAACFGSSSC
uniref:G2/M-phase specific E3 ubiquitin protein ligase n=1 Tax=Cyprinodon variegatus TaxID=28743 RepID=A0A3Q2FLA8_CYPVA